MHHLIFGLAYLTLNPGSILAAIDLDDVLSTGKNVFWEDSYRYSNSHETEVKSRTRNRKSCGNLKFHLQRFTGE